jgi:NAD+ kinase
VSGQRSIGFLLHPREETHGNLVAAAIELAEQHGFSTWTSVAHAEADLVRHRAETALLVTLGGDGTFLYGARLAAPLGIPVLGVNRGQLGFLTDIEVSQLHDAIDDFCAGRHRMQRRSLLELVVPGTGGAEGVEALALNEVVLKSGGVSLARMRVEADEELLGEFDADGIIVATSTGSTAYALSAGGPPVDPRVRALLVVPLAPHAVVTRAVVVPEAVTIHVTMLHGRGLAATDGHAAAEVAPGTRVTVRPGPELQVVQIAGSPSFLRRLREKVRFGTPLKAAIEDDDLPASPEQSSAAGPLRRDG